MKKKYILFLLLISTTLFSTPSIKLNNIQEYKITQEKTEYKIEAITKNISYKKLKKFRFYNKDKIASNSSYYLDGNFSTKILNIDFKKAYYLEGKFIMLNLKGKYKDITFFAKKAIYFKDNLTLKNTNLRNGKKKYRKYTYKLKLN